VALITEAAASGFGREIALAFAREGADVAVNYRASVDGAADVVRSARALGRRASVFRADVAHEDQVQASVTDVLREFGRLDILVNNAMFDINVRGTMLRHHAVRPARAAGDDRAAARAHYQSLFATCPRHGGCWLCRLCCHQGGRGGIHLALAHEVGAHGVMVNAIAPGESKPI
jgi:NAD(P)-dependent dehydrogenase (short-subunit alcohol dehydrogenase family)